MSTHNEVAHAWANQTGRHRKGFNMFYEGDTIYSYGHHFPIARIVDTDEGRVVLLTTRSYSVSTSRHITYTTRAVRHMKVLRVNEPARSGWEVANVQDYLQRIKDMLEASKRARIYGPTYLMRAMGLITEVQDYIRLFKVEGFETFNWAPEAIVEGIREADRIRLEREEQARKDRREAERRTYREQVWPSLKRWLRGETLAVVSRAIRTSRPLPRIERDEVVTTWGASVPLEIAKTLYWMAVKCRREHREFVPSKTIRAGDFALTRIKANGDLVVGCHDIPFWFMRYAACRNNIPDAQPLAA